MPIRREFRVIQTVEILVSATDSHRAFEVAKRSVKNEPLDEFGIIREAPRITSVKVEEV